LLQPALLLGALDLYQLVDGCVFVDTAALASCVSRLSGHTCDDDI